MNLIKATWEINRQCNADCVHCYVDGSNSSVVLKEEDCHTVIDKLVDGGIIQLSISGGEPILSKNFRIIAGYAASKGMEVSVITNGFSLKSDDIKFLKDNHIFPSVSFHAGTKETFERIYQIHQKYFEWFLENLNQLTQFSLSTSLMEQNKEDLEPMIDIARTFNAKLTRWSVYNLRESRRGYSFAKDLSQDEKDKIAIYLAYRASVLQLPLVVALEDKRKENCPLVNGQNSLFVDPSGRIRPCYALVDFVSEKNLVDHPLEEVVHTSVLEMWKNPFMNFDNRCKAELLERGYSLEYTIQAGGKDAFLASRLRFNGIQVRKFGNKCRFYNPQTKKAFMVDVEREDILAFNNKTVQDYLAYLVSKGYNNDKETLINLHTYIRSLEENSILSLLQEETKR